MRLVLSVVGVVFVGSILHVWAQGGYLNPSTSASYSRWNTEQALNAMSTPYTMVDADSVGCVIATKYGTHHRLVRFANYSGTTQKIKVISANTGDTSVVVVPSESVSEKTSVIRKVISGMVVDSTRMDFVYE